MNLRSHVVAGLKPFSAVFSQTMLPTRTPVFAYGSNLDCDQMTARCPSAVLAGSAVLDGHRLEFNRFSNAWQGGVADVVPDATSEVWGLVWQIDPEEIVILDHFEVVPDGYDRNVLPVRSPRDGLIMAWTYQVVKKSPHVVPTPDYVSIILRACSDHRFPDSYRRAVEAAASGERLKTVDSMS